MSTQNQSERFEVVKDGNVSRVVDRLRADWSRNGIFGTVSAHEHMATYMASALNRLNAEWEAKLRTATDHPIARLQLPDGSVPGNTIECAEAWKRWYDQVNQTLGELRRVVDAIEQLRKDEMEFLEICPDNPEAESIDNQALVTRRTSHANWREQRFYGRTWIEALLKARQAQLDGTAGELVPEDREF